MIIYALAAIFAAIIVVSFVQECRFDPYENYYDKVIKNNQKGKY